MATIKASELRIGNYLLMKFPKTTKAYIVSVLSLNNEYPDSSAEKGTLVVNIDTPNFSLYGAQVTNLRYLLPIPISEELLMRNAFKKELAFPKSSMFSLTKTPNNEYFLTINRDYITDVQVKFLHQLQNLYYALNNKELKLDFEGSQTSVTDKTSMAPGTDAI